MAADLTGIASTISAQRAQVLDQWVALVAETLRGRLTPAELEA